MLGDDVGRLCWEMMLGDCVGIWCWKDGASLRCCEMLLGDVAAGIITTFVLVCHSQF